MPYPLPAPVYNAVGQTPGSLIDATLANAHSQALANATAGRFNILEQSATAGSGTFDDSAALYSTDTANNGHGVSTLPPTSGSYRVSVGGAIAHAIEIPPSALLAPDSGQAITINGPLRAGAYPIFGGAGTVALGPGAAPDGARWEWWGTNAAALQAAITAAEGTGAGQAKVICQPGTNYSIASGVTLKRSTILDLNGATVTYTGSSGTPFTQSTASDTGWQVGGVRNGKLVGSGGTATGAQIGNGTASAQGIVYENVEITGFQDGALVTSTTGQAFLDNLRSCAIHNNSRDGVRIAASAMERLDLTGCAIFDNGGAGIHNLSGSVATVYVFGGSLDSNGTNILNDSGGTLRCECHGVHLEQQTSGTAPHLAQNSATGTSVVKFVGGEIVTDVASSAALISVAAGYLTMLGVGFGLNGFSAPPVALGDSNNHSVVFKAIDGEFNSSGSAAVNWVNKVTTAGSTLIILGNGPQTGSTLALYGGNVGSGDTIITDCGDAAYGTLRVPAVATPSVAIGGGRAWTVAPIGLANNVAYGTVAANSSNDATVTVTGAAVGNRTTAFPNASWPAGVTLSAWVSAANTVTVRAANCTTGSVVVGTVSTTIYVDG